MRFLSPARALVTVSLVCALTPAPAFSAPSKRDMRTALVALYPLTRVGMHGLTDFDYTRVTEPGPIFAVRLPGIYADVANTKNAILETNYSNGKITQQTGFSAAFGGNTTHSRTLAPNEKVYVMQITVKKDAVLMELLTVDVTTLGDGRSTRYRAELNIKVPGLEEMTPEDIKKTIDTVLTDPATASAVESKTIKLGMTPDEVKKSLGQSRQDRRPWPQAGLHLQGHEGGIPQQPSFGRSVITFLAFYLITRRRGGGNVGDASSTGVFQGAG